MQDFKRVQNVLQEKLEENEEQMIENEKKVKETIEIINRKIEFDKEMYKNFIQFIYYQKLILFILSWIKKIKKKGNYAL